tara:strand:+ start:571 stop:807 length:237 start_codon:yes stop_codon:yes gene_type:complete
MRDCGQTKEQMRNMMSDKIKKEYNNIAVWDLTFYRLDDDGNELKDDQGKVITYRAETDCTYLAEGLDIDDLEVVEDER